MRKCQPFITIGIASYNYSRYLRRAFEAIKRQTFKDFEVLYADDGSTDNSVSIIQSFIADNPSMNIRLIQGENVGLMGNKQRLVDHAKGVYLMICDADDWMDDNCLEVLSAVAKKTNADRIVSEIRNINGETGKEMYIQSFSKYPSKWCEALHHGAIYKLSVIQDNHITMPKVLPDDFVFVTKFNMVAQLTEFVRDSVYNWCLHNNSESHRGWQKNKWRGASILKNIFRFFDELKKKDLLSFAEKDIEEIILFLVKSYCYYNIKDISRIRPLRKAHVEYNKMRELFIEKIPNYRNMIFKRKINDSPFRPKLHLTICVFCLLEKAHILFPALMLYGSFARHNKGSGL